MLVRASAFSAAHASRARLLARLSAVSGVGTLLDSRRYEDYDAGNAVDQYLNILQVRAALKVNESLYSSNSSSSSSSSSSSNYKACSAAVAAAMDADVMRSTARLFPDILDAGVPVLVYVGVEDVQDGAAATDAWLSRLTWSASKDFRRATRALWRLKEAVVDDERFGGGCSDAEGGASSSPSSSPSSSSSSPEGLGGNAIATGSLFAVDERASLPSSPSSSSDAAAAAPVVGYWRKGGGLDHVTVRNAGHMLPHDQPVVALAMLARWSADVLSGSESMSRSRAGPSSSASSFSSSAAAA